MLKRVLFVVAIALAVAWVISACSEPEPGEISVTIKMKSGAVPPSYFVVLQDQKGAEVMYRVSDSYGVCYLSPVPPGTYTVILKDRTKNPVPGATQQVTLQAGGSEMVSFEL